MTEINATYSPEDNKLRLYASSRLDREAYDTVRGAGFKWAPRQSLYVAPKWTPAREDLCLELAGEIEEEETTLQERADAKAERLTELSEKRERQSNAFHSAARSIASHIPFGQPILVGHHSERRHRNDLEKIDRNMGKAVAASEAARYWEYRSDGVTRHAAHKGRSDVRARRIKRLLADMRAYQRQINHVELCLDIWTGVQDLSTELEREEQALHWAGGHIESGATAPYFRTGGSLYSRLNEGTITTDDAINLALSHYRGLSESRHAKRWISHLLNRLAYERDNLGAVAKFDGPVTKTILQAFARSQGAHKPVAEELEFGWRVKSEVPLPAHLSDGKTLSKTCDEWRDLIQGCGYEVPTKSRRASSAPKKPPLINPTPEDARKLQALWNAAAESRNQTHETKGAAQVLEITQSKYSRLSGGAYSPCSTIELDANGMPIRNVRDETKPAAIVRVRIGPGAQTLWGADAVIILTDKPSKSLPLDWD